MLIGFQWTHVPKNDTGNEQQNYRSHANIDTGNVNKTTEAMQILIVIFS